MKYLDAYKEEDLIFFDIETARGVKELKPGTPLHDAWLYKSRYNNELNKKTGKDYTPEEYFNEKAALYAPFGRVVSIVAGGIRNDVLKVKVYSNPDESELLKEFNNDLGKSAKAMTAFCGWQNVGFDQPYLAKRMLVHGITPHKILDTSGDKPWEIRVVDLASLWKGTSFYPDPLVAVAVAMGLPSPKSSMDGSEVSDAFYEGRIEEINNYCTQDVLAVANIYRRFKGKGIITLG